MEFDVKVGNCVILQSGQSPTIITSLGPFHQDVERYFGCNSVNTVKCIGPLFGFYIYNYMSTEQTSTVVNNRDKDSWILEILQC